MRGIAGPRTGRRAGLRLTGGRSAGIDPAPCSQALVRGNSRLRDDAAVESPREHPDEAHLSAPQRQPRPHARLPCPHVHPRRSSGHRSSSPSRPQAPRGPAQRQVVALAPDCRRMKPEGFPAIFRLRKRREFLRVQNGGQKHHTRHFLVFVAPPASQVQPGGHTSGEELAAMVRLGITVTRKVGPAVVRNRIKRLVREAFRRKRSLFASACDMVWVAKQSASTVRYAEVVAAMDAMSRRISPRPTGPGTLPGSSAC